MTKAEALHLQPGSVYVWYRGQLLRVVGVHRTAPVPALALRYPSPQGESPTHAHVPATMCTLDERS